MQYFLHLRWRLGLETWSDQSLTGGQDPFTVVVGLLPGHVWRPAPSLPWGSSSVALWSGFMGTWSSLSSRKTAVILHCEGLFSLHHLAFCLFFPLICFGLFRVHVLTHTPGGPGLSARVGVGTVKLSGSFTPGCDSSAWAPCCSRKMAWLGGFLGDNWYQHCQGLPLTCTRFSGGLFQPCAWRETAWLLAPGGRGDASPHALRLSAFTPACCPHPETLCFPVSGEGASSPGPRPAGPRRGAGAWPARCTDFQRLS